MPQWQAVVLIILCCASLIIALYCLFFMMPVKRFWEYIRSLGGGMKGFEAHLAKVQEEISRRLAELEQNTQDQVEQTRESAEEAREKLSRESREARRELERVRKDLQALQAELRATAADSMKVSQGTAALTGQLQQLRTDFDVLDVEIRESVRQQVASAFSSVESTVLAALDAIQDEIIHAGPPPRDPGKPFRPDKGRPRTDTPFGRGPGRRTPENIITVKPLFDESEQENGGNEREESPEAEEPEADGENAQTATEQEKGDQ